MIRWIITFVLLLLTQITPTWAESCLYQVIYCSKLPKCSADSTDWCMCPKGNTACNFSKETCSNEDVNANGSCVPIKSVTLVYAATTTITRAQTAGTTTYTAPTSTVNAYVSVTNTVVGVSTVTVTQVGLSTAVPKSSITTNPSRLQQGPRHAQARHIPLLRRSNAVIYVPRLPYRRELNQLLLELSPGLTLTPSSFTIIYIPLLRGHHM